jgi:stage III sporulation protein AD
MADLIKIIGAAFLTAATCSVLKVTKPELAFAVMVAGAVIILLFILDALEGSLTVLHEIAQMTGMENGVVRILVKIVGVGYLTEFSAGILNDCNTSSVADKVVLAGKLTVIVMSLPILGGLLELFKQFIALL